MSAHCVSVNVMRIKVTSHLATLNHSAADMGILKLQQTLVTIRRTSDILIELGDRSAGAQHMAFFRGPNGSEYFGSGSTGIPSDAFQGWWAQENAAGHYLAVAGTKGYQFVASWASA